MDPSPPQRHLPLTSSPLHPLTHSLTHPFTHSLLHGPSDANLDILYNTNTYSQQLVREIESQAIAAQQQISLVRTQVASKQREMRMTQLTRGEIAALPADTAVYEGVGKM